MPHLLTLEARVRARSRRPSRTIRRPRPPVALGLELARALIGMLREAEAEARPLVERALRRLDRSGSPTRVEREDGLSDPVVEEAVRGIRVILTEKFTERNTRPALLAAMRKLGRFNTRDMSRVLRVDVPAELGMGQAVQQFVRENLRLVRGMSDRVAAEVADTLTSGTGLGAEQLAEAVSERFRMGEVRAARIARDQVLKTNAMLTRVRQTAAGVREYEWSSSGDERVRDEHREADGQVFRWDTPPAVTGGYHPGEDIFCRCVAVPVLPGGLGGESGTD